MKATTHTAGLYCRQNGRERTEDGSNYCDRVQSVEGSKPHSRVRPEGAGSVHRQSWDHFEVHSTDHEPYQSAKASRPAEPQNLDELKDHQTAMLTNKAKQKRRGKY